MSGSSCPKLVCTPCRYQCETGAMLPSPGDDGKEEAIQSHSGFLTISEETAESLDMLRFRNRDEDDLKLVTMILEGLIKMETVAKRREGEWNLYAMEIRIPVDEDAEDFENLPAELEVPRQHLGEPCWTQRRSRQNDGGGLRP